MNAMNNVKHEEAAEEAEEDEYKIKILDTIPSPIKPETPPLLNDIITLTKNTI